jgi:hypothetical protein
MCPYPAVYFRGVQYQNGAFDCGIVIANYCGRLQCVRQYFKFHSGKFISSFCGRRNQHFLVKKKKREFVITDGRDKISASCRIVTAPWTVPIIQDVSFFIVSPKTGSCNGESWQMQPFYPARANHKTRTLRNSQPTRRRIPQCYNTSNAAAKEKKSTSQGMSCSVPSNSSYFML